eukprot:gene7196-301_t
MNCSVAAAVKAGAEAEDVAATAALKYAISTSWTGAPFSHFLVPLAKDTKEWMKGVMNCSVAAALKAVKAGAKAEDVATTAALKLSSSLSSWMLGPCPSIQGEKQ